MEGIKYKGKEAMHGGVFDSIIAKTSNNHLKQIDCKRSFEEKLDSLQKPKKTQMQLRQLMNSLDIQPKHDDRRIKQTKENGLKLPKISNIKSQEKTLLVQEEKKVAKENKIQHLPLQNEKKRKQLRRSIKNGQITKNIASRSQFKLKSLELH